MVIDRFLLSAWGSRWSLVLTSYPFSSTILRQNLFRRGCPCFGSTYTSRDWSSRLHVCPQRCYRYHWEGKVPVGGKISLLIEDRSNGLSICFKFLFSVRSNFRLYSSTGGFSVAGYSTFARDCWLLSSAFGPSHSSSLYFSSVVSNSGRCGLPWTIYSPIVWTMWWPSKL